MNRNAWKLVLLWAVLAVHGTPAASEGFSPLATAPAGTVPGGINYQGRLEKDGFPVTGTRTVIFRLYDSATGGVLLWDSGPTAVQVQDGLFAAVLSIPVEALSGTAQKHLELSVEGVTLSPREPLQSVPYALIARTIEGDIEISTASLNFNSSALGSVLFLSSATGRVGVGVTSPDDKLHVIGQVRVDNDTDTSAKGCFRYNGALSQLEYSNDCSAFQGFAAAAAGGWTDDGAVVRLTASGDNAVIQSTLTVQGGGFSVGGSTLVVAGGKVGVGGAPTKELTVAGDFSAEGTVPAGTAAEFFANDFNQAVDAGVNNQRVALVRLRDRGSDGIFAGVVRPLLVSENAGGGQHNVQLFQSGLRLGSYPGGGAAVVAPSANLELKGFGNGAGGHVLRTQNLAGSELLSVQNDGTVGVGTSQPQAPLHVSSAAGSAGDLVLVSTGASTLVRVTGLGEVFAGRFIGDGSGLTNVGGGGGGWTDDGTVVRLTASNDNVVVESTLTVQGNAFSVGAATLTVREGNVGIGATSPGEALHIRDGNALIQGPGELNIRVQRTDLADNPTFAQGRIIIAGDGSPEYRFVYSDDSTPERSVFEFDEKGIIASVKPAVGSHFEGFISGDVNPLFRLNSFPSMQLEFGPGGAGATDVIMRRTAGADLAFLTGTSTTALLHAGGNVGVGVTIPAARLHVSSGNAVAADTVFQVSSGTASGQELLSVRGDGGLYLTQTATPSDPPAGSGVLYVRDDAGTPKAFFKNAGGTEFDLTQGGGSGGWTEVDSAVQLADPNDNVVVQSTLTVQGDAFSVGGSTLVIKDGKVGVGTTDPQSALHATGNAVRIERVDAGPQALLHRTGAPLGGGDLVGSVIFSGLDSLGDQTSFALVEGIAQNAADGAESGDVRIRTMDNGTLREHVRISSSGSLGVGTSAPGDRLHVIGQVRIDNDTNTTDKGCFRYNGSSNELEYSNDCVAFQGFAAAAAGGWTDDGTVVRLTNSGDNVVVQSTLTVQGNAFSVGESTLSVKEGKVGIGTDDPDHLLVVKATDTATRLVTLVNPGDNRPFGQLYYNSTNMTAGGLRIEGRRYANSGTGVQLMGFSNPGLSGVTAVKIDAQQSDGTDFQGPLLSVANNASVKLFVDVEGKLGVGATGPAATLHVSSGGILADGSTGAPSASGAGHRFMWIPSSAAIRAGGVGGAEWDAANIGAYSTAFGQDSSASGDHATVGGGSGNLANSFYDVVGGGQNNTATGPSATVGGGFVNTADGLQAVVSGGFSNRAVGSFSAVAGGAFNEASGENSTVPGGDSNLASGDYSLAAGRRAQATAQGAFVWADSTDADLLNKVTDQFLIRAQGGFEARVSSFGVTTSTGHALYTLDVSSAHFTVPVYVNGVQLGAGGGTEWTDTGSLLHPADLSGAQDVAVGGTTAGSADILLRADGSATFNEQGGAVDFRVESDTDPNLLFIEGTGAGNVAIGTNIPFSVAKFQVRTGTDDNLRFATLGGMMDIGIFNDAGNALRPLSLSAFTLKVDGQDHFAGGDNQNLFVYSDDSQAADRGGSLGLGGTYTGTTQITFASLSGRKANATNGDTGGYLMIETRPSGGSLTERVRITGDGEVGVGTTDPAAALHVSSPSAAEVIFLVSSGAAAGQELLGVAGDGGLYLTETVAPSDPPAGLGVLYVRDDAGASKPFFKNAAGTEFDLAQGGGGGWTDDGTTVRLTDAGDSAVIQSTLTVQGNAFSVGVATLAVREGKVGIGTSDPAAVLDVQGGAYHLGGSADVNGDGSVTALDTLAIANYLNDGSLTPAQYARADVNGDGRVNSLDFDLITAILNGDITLSEARHDVGKFVMDVLISPTLGGVGINRLEPDATLHVSTEAPNADSLILLVSTGAAGQALVVRGDGRVGIGTSNPAHRLSVTAAGATQFGAEVLGVHAETITSGGGAAWITTDGAAASNEHFLVMATEVDSIPDTEFRFQTDGNAFADGSFTGGGADYAEYFEKADPKEDLPPGTIIALEGGKARAARDGDRFIVGVVSSKPGFVGNNGDIEERRSERRDKWVLVGLMGQIEVRVRGPVRHGDYIVPGDGGMGRPVEAWSPAAVGRAMADFKAERPGAVLALVK